MARIFYPAKFKEQVELINRISRKHSDNGMQSELTDFNIGVLKSKPMLLCKTIQRQRSMKS